MKLQQKLFFYLVTAFMFFTVIGTLSHEFGHIIVAKTLGYETTLHFGSMNHYPKGFYNDTIVKEYKELTALNKKNFDKNVNYPDEERLKELHFLILDKYPNNRSDSNLITMGGPLQTFLTSILGLFLLYYFKTAKQFSFRIKDWFAVFLSLFALREIFNFVVGLYSFLFLETKFFNGDEFKLSRNFGFNQWVVPIITMLIGAIICIYVVFKVLPNKYRISFLIAGFLGGIIGFILWFNYLGKLMLP